MSKWISVKDQLPEEGEMVDAKNVRTKVIYPELYYDPEKKKWFDENYAENGEYDKPPTHWRKIKN